MSKNIEIEYKDGRPLWYVTKPTPELIMPSMAFSKEEEAELAVAIAKVLISYGIEINTNSELSRDVQYTFRALGLVESEWFGMPDKQ